MNQNIDFLLCFKKLWKEIEHILENEALIFISENSSEISLKNLKEKRKESLNNHLIVRFKICKIS